MCIIYLFVIGEQKTTKFRNLFDKNKSKQTEQYYIRSLSTVQQVYYTGDKSLYIVQLECV